MTSVLLTLLLAIALPAAPTHYVTDNAGVLPADRAAALEEKLKAFERETSDQVIVYTDHHIPEGTTLEEMGAEAIRTWGVGQKEKNNGVILFLFSDDHQYRIEVGYGLEGSLTDAKSKDITSVVMKPLLREGDYAGAIETGVDAILATARGEKYKGVGLTVAERAHGNWQALSASTDPDPGHDTPVFVFVFLAGGFLFLCVFMTTRTSSSGSSSSSDSWSDSSSSSSDSWSSSSSSSSSSSGFSGGGGSGGGGGASDSW